MEFEQVFDSKEQATVTQKVLSHSTAREDEGICFRAQVQAYLRKKKAELEEINAKIELLQKKFAESKKQQEELKNKIQEC